MATEDECRLDDDGAQSGYFIVIEEGGPGCTPQALWLRVGPAFHGDDTVSGPYVWVEYQEGHMATPMSGPVMLTPRAWRQLDRAVRRRLRRFRLESYGRRRK